MTSQNEKPLNSNIIYPLAVAAVWWFLYEYVIDNMVAYPLRLASAKIAAVLLDLIGIENSLDSTIISTSVFEFDVSSECSGSTTLRFMILTALLLLFLTKNISAVNKCVALIIAVALAVVVNGIRVATISYLSMATNIPIYEHSLAHSVTGIFFYGLAVGLFWFALSKFERRDDSSRTRKHILALLGVVCSVILFIPFLSQSIRLLLSGNWNPWSWTTPGFFLAGFILFVCTLLVTSEQKQKRLTGLPLSLVIAATLVALLARVIETDAFSGGALLLFFLGFAVYSSGWKSLCFYLPAFAVMLVGLPKSSLLLQHVLLLTKEYIQVHLAVLVIKLFILALAVAAQYWLAGKMATQAGVLRNLECYKGIVHSGAEYICRAFGVLFLGCMAIVLLPDFTGQSKDARSIELPYIIDNWVGRDAGFAAGLTVFNGNSYLCRRYINVQNRSVEILVNNAGGNRREIHLPEYCFINAGWTLTGEMIVDLANGGIKNAVLKKDGEVQHLAYWYWDGRRMIASYSGFVFRDILARLGSEQIHWQIYRVVSANESDLNEFISVFQKYFSTF